MDTVSIWAAVITVLVSVTSSIIITAYQSRIEISKLRKLLEQQYAKSLFDKRLDVYPNLYRVLSRYAKIIQYNQNTVANIIQFRDDLDKWDIENALLLTSNTSRLAGKFRHYLDTILSEGKKSKITENEYHAIWKMIAWYEHIIRKEVGIIDTLPPGESERRLEEVLKYIDDVRKGGVEVIKQRELPVPWKK